MIWQLALVSLLVSAAPAQAVVEISNVRHSPAAIDPARGVELAVQLAITEPARVRVDVYDPRDVRVRRIESDGLLEKGSHTLVWDGRDDEGRVVPPEAYHYVVEATGRDADHYVFDLTDSTGHAPVDATDVRWDAEAGVVRFRLSEPSRVSVRLGLLNGGPILASLVDWMPRSAGPQAVHWNGRDRSDVVDLAAHPKLGISVVAYSLPMNAVLVGPVDEMRRLSRTDDGNADVRASERKSRFGDLARKPYDDLPPLDLSLALPETLARTAEGVPILEGRVPVQVDVGNGGRSRALAEGFEMLFFVDGGFAYEEEMGYLPANWMLDTSSMNAGLHYVTGNLMGYEGGLGTATLEVLVPDRSDDPPPSGPGR